MVWFSSTDVRGSVTANRAQVDNRTVVRNNIGVATIVEAGSSGGSSACRRSEAVDAAKGVGIGVPRIGERISLMRNAKEDFGRLGLQTAPKRAKVNRRGLVDEGFRILRHQARGAPAYRYD
jgi:hypothetical protein